VSFRKPPDRAALGLILASAILAGCGGNPSAPVIGRCAIPDVEPYVLTAVAPFDPPMAVQEGIHGPVNVIVSLDARSNVVGAVVQSSPSQLLDAAAIQAAKASTYATRIANCVPVASYIVFVAQFSEVLSLPPPGP
jgi:hypothetical protein